MHAWQVPALAVLLVCGTSCSANAQAFDPRDPHSPLQLVRTIELPDVRGRIDHMSLDAERRHLFVAEYGNGSVDEIDLTSGKVIARIANLREPQGVMWLPKEQEIAVACGDGSLRFFRGADHQEVVRIDLGDDADNVRLDPRNGNLVVGYGAGGLAVIDPAAHRIVHELKLGAHPEAFSLVGSRVFANVPDASQIAIGDLDQARVITTVSTGKFGENYPMAADATGSRLAVAYRSPNTVAVIDTASGAMVYTVPICGDADDLFFRGGGLVVVCGEGAVELIGNGDDHSSALVATRRGARTGLLDPDRANLFVAVPAKDSRAAIWQLSFGR